MAAPAPTKKSHGSLQASTLTRRGGFHIRPEGLRLPHTTMGGQHPPLQRKPSGSLQASTTRRGGFHIRPGRLAAAAHNHGWAAPAPYKESLPGRCRHRPSHVGADSISAREGLRLPHTTMGGQHPPPTKKAFRVVAGIDHTHVGADSISAREGTQPWVGSTRPLQRKPSGSLQASTTRRGGFHIRPGRLAAAAHNHGWAAPAPYKEKAFRVVAGIDHT